jgi:hypothetical protein
MGDDRQIKEVQRQFSERVEWYPDKYLRMPRVWRSVLREHSFPRRSPTSKFSGKQNTSLVDILAAGANPFLGGDVFDSESDDNVFVLAASHHSAEILTKLLAYATHVTES